MNVRVMRLTGCIDILAAGLLYLLSAWKLCPCVRCAAGKSHTMEGRDEPVEERGIMPNTFAYVFEQIAKESESAAEPAACMRRAAHLWRPCLAEKAAARHWLGAAGALPRAEAGPQPVTDSLSGHAQGRCSPFCVSVAHAIRGLYVRGMWAYVNGVCDV